MLRSTAAQCWNMSLYLRATRRDAERHLTVYFPIEARHRGLDFHSRKTKPKKKNWWVLVSYITLAFLSQAGRAKRLDPSLWLACRQIARAAYLHVSGASRFWLRQFDAELCTAGGCWETRKKWRQSSSTTSKAALPSRAK